MFREDSAQSCEIEFVLRAVKISFPEKVCNGSLNMEHSRVKFCVACGHFPKAV